MTKFTYQPSRSIPFRDLATIELCRKIKRSQIEKHPNPDFRIRVVKDDDVAFLWFGDIVGRIIRARDEGRQLVMILPNPWPGYRHVARLLNEARIDCRHVHVFAMDEYADQDGHIAPEGWEWGFGHAMLKFFWGEIDSALRPPRKQFTIFSDRNIKDYGRRIADLGGADICYSGPGWTGHLAFIEPDAPEFDMPLAQWKKCGPRIVTMSPFTLAQNSLHGCFGFSGDLAAVPPKAATIGPTEVIAAKNRFDMHAITVHGTATSWQRLTTRLCLHGPVTPRMPASILQTLPTNVYVSETAAMNIEPTWDKGY